jgi:hypothetical protein
VKSAAFAAAHGLPELNQVLHPRVKGLAHALACTRFTALVDYTIAYEGGVPSQESSLLIGPMPRRVHVHARTWGAETIAAALVAALPKDARSSSPSTLAGLALRIEPHVCAWLQQRWAVKEVALAAFFDDEAAGERRLHLDVAGAEAACVEWGWDTRRAIISMAQRREERCAQGAPAASPLPVARYAFAAVMTGAATAALLIACLTHGSGMCAYLGLLLIALYVALPLTLGSFDTWEVTTFSPSLAG